MHLFRHIALSLALPALLLQAQPNEQALIQTATVSTNLHDQAMAIDALGHLGSNAAIKPLADLLPHPQLHDYARDALARISDPAAAKALLDASSTLTGQQRIGVVITLGEIRYAPAVTALSTLTRSEDSTLAASAIMSLGLIASPESIAALEALLASENSITRTHAAHALLASAQHLEKTDSNASARLRDKVKSAAGLPASKSNP